MGGVSKVWVSVTLKERWRLRADPEKLDLMHMSDLHAGAAPLQGGRAGLQQQRRVISVELAASNFQEASHSVWGINFSSSACFR